MRLGVGVLLLGSAGMTFGQQPPSWQPEVRRAIPAEESASTPAPPRAIPVARARGHAAFAAAAGGTIPES